jgi:hypothetical protein
MRDAARSCSIRLRVVHVKRTRIRLIIFGLLIRLAVAISPTNVDVVTD